MLDRNRNKSKIHILSLQTGTGIGGTELRGFSVLTNLNKDKFKVTVCFLMEQGPISEMYHQAGIEVIHLNHSLSFRFIGRLWKLLQKNRFDIIEIYGFRLNIIGRVLGRLSGHRCIITMQRSVDDWRLFWHSWLDRLTSRWIRLFISNSYAGSKRLQEREKIQPSKIKVIQNGIEAEIFAQADKGLIKKELAIEQNKTIITCVATFRKAKAHHVLIDAISLLAKDNHNFCLLLIGDGSMKPGIEKKVHQLGLENMVFFLGERRDIPNILIDSDIFVLTSSWEGMPGVIMEAMAAGLPVVATDVGGMSELVKPEKTGILVPPNNPEKFALSMERLVKDKALQQEMGNAGFKRIREHFSLYPKVSELEMVYQKFVNAKKRDNFK